MRANDKLSKHPCCSSIHPGGDTSRSRHDGVSDEDLLSSYYVVPVRDEGDGASVEGPPSGRRRHNSRGHGRHRSMDFTGKTGHAGGYNWGKLGQYQDCWCPGSWCRQAITSHDIDCEMGMFLPTVRVKLNSLKNFRIEEACEGLTHYGLMMISLCGNRKISSIIWGPIYP